MVIPVEEALVITEEDAKMFWVKRLRKRKAFDPRDRVISVVGRMSPDRLRRERDVVARVLVPSTLKREVTVWLVEEELARVVCPVMKVGPLTVRAVAEAFERVVCPVTVSVEAVVVARVEVPRTLKREEIVSLVLEALVILPVVAKRAPVVVLLVNVEEVAKIFCEKRLRKRKALDPRDRVISDVGRMSPDRLRRERDVVARVLVPSTLKREVTVWFVEEELASTV